MKTNQCARIRFDPDNNTIKWVSYFDLLGFSSLVDAGNDIKVFTCYQKAVTKFNKKSEGTLSISRVWFSDTFVLYSSNDSLESFLAIERVSRWFIYFLITDSIPVQGAMACGKLYTDIENNIFWGPALIESYQYTECQDWIGFVLCPSATKRMSSFGFSGERLNYSFHGIPQKPSCKFNLIENCPAYILGEHCKINGKNLCIEKLEDMKLRLNDTRIIDKYDRTLAFIKAHKRTLA